MRTTKLTTYPVRLSTQEFFSGEYFHIDVKAFRLIIKV